MDRYTEVTRDWLNQRYRGECGVYRAHEPIYGIGAGFSEPDHARRIARLFQLLRAVRAAGGGRLLDVGGAEGYFAFLCHRLFGMEVVSVDLASEACRRAAEIFAIPGAAVDAERLPFASGTFDIVTCAEVVEHLANPVPSILELQRVSSNAVVLATEEWLRDEAERDRMLAARDFRLHGERCIYADCDSEPLFSPATTELERQVVPDLRAFGDDQKIDRSAFKEHLLSLATAPERASGGSNGIVLTALKKGAPGPLARKPGDEEIVDLLLHHATPLHSIPARTPAIAFPGWCTLQCPSAEGAMAISEGGGLHCATCGTVFERKNGVFELFCPIEEQEDPVRLALERRGSPYDQAHLRALQALADKLRHEYPDRRSWWDFETEQGRQNWEWHGGLRHEGGCSFTAHSADPQMISPWIGLRMSKVRAITIEMAAKGAGPTTDTPARLLPLFSEMAEFDAREHLAFPVRMDGELRTYRVETPADARASERILLRFRLDPASSPCELIVKRIALELETS